MKIDVFSQLELSYQDHMCRLGKEPSFFIVSLEIFNAIDKGISFASFAKKVDSDYVGVLFRGIPVIAHPWAKGVHSAS